MTKRVNHTLKEAEGENMKLYEITNELERHLEAYNEVESQEGLDAIEKQIDSLEIAFKDKAVSVAHFIRNREYDIDTIEKEIARLTAKKASIESAKESLRGYLKRCMLETGTEKIETPITKISFRKSQRVEIVDESKIPLKYWQEKIVKTIMKKEIKADWENGIGVEGTVIIEDKHLQIK
jgi:hypothetical protein